MNQWYLLKNTDGKKSVSYTMLVATFTVLTLWLTLSIFQKIHHLEIREFDAGSASVWFAPIASLYFGRKWQSNASATPKSKKKDQDGTDEGKSTETEGNPESVA